MGTTASSRPANAGAITRILGASGLPIGRATSAHRGVVQGGWTTFTEGVTSTQVMDLDRRRVRRGSKMDGTPRYTWVSNNTPTGWVRVEYQTASGNRRSTDEWRDLVETRLSRAAEVLTDRGFTVNWVRGPLLPHLMVARMDAAGSVIVF